MNRHPYLFLAFAATAAAQSAAPWKFAISGDSRNCGDIVMPAIAEGVKASGSEFYWHLGDLRAIYTYDEDMVPPGTKPPNIIDYEIGAWPDFIAHQIAPFGNMPFYLIPGNHETIPPATREQYLIQFADWLVTPTLQAQRLKDDPKDHKLRSYYHWIERNIDFIAMDNASRDQFDDAQKKWFHGVVEQAVKSPQIQTIIVGIHAALPGSVGTDHSMSDWAQGEQSGRDMYQTLWRAQSEAHKRVYILASHSHFYMEDVYNTPTWKGKVLPGWIVGTAGAVRYPLPEGVAPSLKARPKVYGYLVGTAAADGSVTFAFHELTEADLLRANPVPDKKGLVHWCYADNVLKEAPPK